MEEVKIDIHNSESSSGAKLDRNISVSEFSCNCCYDILVNPTTLNCGHSFCRHCLALWWVSSKKTECPECRNKWEGIPKVNILLRDIIEKRFPDTIKEKYENLELNSEIARALQAFNKYGNDKNQSSSRSRRGFFSGVLIALMGVAVVLLVYHWSSRESGHDLLVHKPVSKWTPEEVVLWLEQLGPWASHYKDRFLSGRVNGRLLLTLAEEEFSKEPYSIESTSHRKAIIMELERVKTRGVKPPQNLWEYQAVNPINSLFLLYGLNKLPRLSMLYIYLFDYEETFLPFIHTTCPQQEQDEEDIITKFIDLQDPTWTQWREFLVKYVLLPYHLLAGFAWDWQEVHYWTSRFIIANAVIASMLESYSFFNFWRPWSTSQLRSLPLITLGCFWNISNQVLRLAILYPFVPQFFWKFMFYGDLYSQPIMNIYLLVRESQKFNTQAM